MTDIPSIDILLIGNKGTKKKEIIKFWLSLDNKGLATIPGNIYSKIFIVEGQPIYLNIHKKLVPEISDTSYAAIVYVCKEINDIHTVLNNMKVYAKATAYQCTILLDISPSTKLFNYDMFSTALDHTSLLDILNKITSEAVNNSNIRRVRSASFSIHKQPPSYLEDEYISVDEINTDCCRLL